jgi:hypothetical protein
MKTKRKYFIKDPEEFRDKRERYRAVETLP